MSDAIARTARPTIPEHVLVQEIEGQTAILHLHSDSYFGLDDIATEIWRAVTSGSTVGEAIDSLAAVYDVEYETLERDVLSLLGRLKELGLLTID